MALFEKSLTLVLKKYGIEQTKNILLKFRCKDNLEVELFLKEKAIIHENKGLSRTILIFDSEIHNNVIGYYTISTKSFYINPKINSKKRKRFFGTSQTNGNSIPSILIGQLGINDAIKSSLNGHKLMNLIFRYIKRMSILTPSLICYVEHNGSQKLIHYYEKYGFTYFKRDEEENNGLYCHIIKTQEIIKTINVI